MKKFIYTLLAFCTLIVSIYFLISIIVTPKNKNTNDYVAAMIDKHRRIEQINSPKIIFAGGSNLAFGLNSEEVEKEFTMPVVNLGLHAGLGLNFILNELKSCIKSGDVVFLSIEYHLDTINEYKLMKHTGNVYKEAKKYYNYDLKSEILLGIDNLTDFDNTRQNIKNYKMTKSHYDLGNIKSNVKHEVDIYSRKAFNKYGDDTANWGKIPPKQLMGRADIPISHWTGIEKLNEFYNYAKSKNVQIFFLYPNYPLTEFKKNEYAINKLQIDLSSNLKMQILNSPFDFVFDDSLFFDTVFHLNKKGRELRTKKLIEIILHTNEQNHYLQYKGKEQTKLKPKSIPIRRCLHHIVSH